MVFLKDQKGCKNIRHIWVKEDSMIKTCKYLHYRAQTALNDESIQISGLESMLKKQKPSSSEMMLTLMTHALVF